MQSPALPVCATLALALAASTAMADDIRPYLRAGFGASLSGDATFRDEDCTSNDPAALFGCGTGDNGKRFGAYGDFGSSGLFELAAGVELTPYLRVEAGLDYRPGLAFEGNANFPRVGSRQPVSGEVTQAAAMAFAYLEPFAALGVDARLRPFLGAGLGMSRNEIGQMRYDFPGAARQPRYSVTPDGTVTDFAWAVSAGLSYEVSDSLILDLAWRYSDFGKVETDRGVLFNQFSSSTLDIEIGETEAKLTSQSLSLSARVRF